MDDSAVKSTPLEPSASRAPLTSAPVAPARLLVAARLGRARLIDNMPAGPAV